MSTYHNIIKFLGIKFVWRKKNTHPKVTCANKSSEQVLCCPNNILIMCERDIKLSEQAIMLSEQIIKLSEQAIKLSQQLKNETNMFLPRLRIYGLFLSFIFGFVYHKISFLERR